MVLDYAGPPILYLAAKTWRIERVGYENYERLRDSDEAFLAAVWHGRTLSLSPLHGKEGLSILVSPSRDGELLGSLLNKLGYGVVWGSSSSRGTGALLDMRKRLKAGHSVVITPDGPIGPRHSINAGIAWLAKETGLPILTTGVTCDRAWRTRSWDKHTIPKLRTRMVLVYGEPIHVPADANDALLASIATDIRDQLLANESKGFEMLGVPCDW